MGSGREWANGVREKMGWKIFGGRKVGSERREGIVCDLVCDWRIQEGEYKT